MKLESGRIRLSRIAEEHLDFAADVECNKALWAYEESVASDHEKAKQQFASKMNATDHFDFVVEAVGPELVGDRLIGLAQLWPYVSHRRSWELGYGIVPEWQGRGYGGEAVIRLLKFAFRQLEAHKVVGMCNAGNIPSARVMEKAGMRREGTFRQELWWRGQWTDQHFYSMLAEEFKGGY